MIAFRVDKHICPMCADHDEEDLLPDVGRSGGSASTWADWGIYNLVSKARSGDYSSLHQKHICPMTDVCRLGQSIFIARCGQIGICPMLADQNFATSTAFYWMLADKNLATSTTFYPMWVDQNLAQCGSLIPNETSWGQWASP